jgi:molybdate transport system permease protein
VSDLTHIAFPLRLSLQVAAVATALVAAVGLPLAYTLATREFRGKSLLDVALTLPLVLPPIVTGYYLLLIVGRNGVLGKAAQALGLSAPQITFTWGAAVLASFAVALPFTVRTARAAFEGVDRELIATSLTLGRSELATAALVTLPLSSRGVIAGLVLSFARALGEFGATVMVAGNIPGRTNTMPLEIHNAVVYGDWLSATVLVAIFTVVSAGFLLAATAITRKVAW